MSLNHRKVLVTSAAGAQGRAIVAQLLEAGATPRVLMREHSANPFGDGVEIAWGDLGDRGSLTRASIGIDAMALTLPQVHDRQAVVRYGRNAVDAAAAAGVPHIVFNASGSVAAGSGVGMMEAKAEVMGHLNSAGVAFTVLIPTIYMDNLLLPSALPSILSGVLAYPLSVGCRVSWLSRDDLGACVVGALQRPDLAGSVFHLGGPDALTGPELVAMLSEAIGRHVGYLPVPPSEFGQRLNRVLGEGVGDQIAAHYAWYDSQPVSPLAVDGSVAARALSVRLRSLREWAASQDWRALAAQAEAA